MPARSRAKWVDPSWLAPPEVEQSPPPPPLCVLRLPPFALSLAVSALLRAARVLLPAGVALAVSVVKHATLLSRALLSSVGERSRDPFWVGSVLAAYDGGPARGRSHTSEFNFRQAAVVPATGAWGIEG